MFSASSHIIDAWRRRQTIKRGVKRNVNLINGNFIAEYPVPTPVYQAIESKYAQTNTTEFSSVAKYPTSFLRIAQTFFVDT